MKVMTILGTRPEIIKLSRVIAQLDKHMDHVLVHSGQNYDYELNQIFFEDLEMRKPDYFLNAVGDTLAQTIGNIIAKSDEVMEKEKPDAILLYGDTNSGLSVISAKRRKIPVFHMEAGNRCFDQRVPEEINRRLIDHLSDINMPLTEHARQYLLREGIRPDTIIKTGSCMQEVLNYYKDKIAESSIMKTLNLKPQEFFLVSAHREENVDREDKLLALIDSLNQIAKIYDKKIIVSTHPRTQKRLEAIADPKREIDKRIQFLKPFSFSDYIHMQNKAYCVLSDSGTITEECSLLGVPGVNMRDAHERPEGMDIGTVVMSTIKAERLLPAIKMVTEQFYNENVRLPIIPDYNVNQVSVQVVRVIQSYVDFVRSTVWRE